MAKDIKQKYTYEDCQELVTEFLNLVYSNCPLQLPHDMMEYTYFGEEYNEFINSHGNGSFSSEFLDKLYNGLDKQLSLLEKRAINYPTLEVITVSLKDNNKLFIYDANGVNFNVGDIVNIKIKKKNKQAVVVESNHTIDSSKIPYFIHVVSGKYTANSEVKLYDGLIEVVEGYIVNENKNNKRQLFLTNGVKYKVGDKAYIFRRFGPHCPLYEVVQITGSNCMVKFSKGEYIESIVNFDSLDDIGGFEKIVPLIRFAAQSNDFELLKKMIQHYKDNNCDDDLGYALLDAINDDENSQKIIEIILNNNFSKARYNGGQQYFKNVLIEKIFKNKNNNVLLKLFIEKHFFNTSDDYLRLAREYLIKERANSSFSPLFNKKEMLEIILKYSTNINIVTDYFMNEANAEIILKVLDYINKDYYDLRSLYEKINLNRNIHSSQILKKLIELGLDINGENKDGYSLLQFSCIEGKISLVKACLKYGALINQINKQKVSPLIISALNKDIKIFELLIENGADINYKYQNKNVLEWIDSKEFRNSTFKQAMYYESEKIRELKDELTRILENDISKVDNTIKTKNLKVSMLLSCDILNAHKYTENTFKKIIDNKIKESLIDSYNNILYAFEKHDELNNDYFDNVELSIEVNDEVFLVANIKLKRVITDLEEEKLVDYIFTTFETEEINNDELSEVVVEKIIDVKYINNIEKTDKLVDVVEVKVNGQGRGYIYESGGSNLNVGDIVYVDMNSHHKEVIVSKTNYKLNPKTIPYKLKKIKGKPLTKDELIEKLSNGMNIKIPEKYIMDVDVWIAKIVGTIETAISYDSKTIIEALEELEDAPIELLNNKKNAIKFIDFIEYSYVYLSEEIRGDCDIYIKAGYPIEDAPQNITDNEELVYETIKRRGIEMLDYASDRLKNNEDFIKKIRIFAK